MTKLELEELLSEYPDNAEVFIQADHGGRIEDVTSVEYGSDFQDDWDFEIDDPVIVLYGL